MGSLKIMSTAIILMLVHRKGVLVSYKLEMLWFFSSYWIEGAAQNHLYAYTEIYKYLQFTSCTLSHSSL